MTTPVVTYREAGHQLLAQAHTELAAGDLRQAAEKGWGAAAQLVKATAEARGWDHDTHRGLFVTVRGLAEETGDTEVHGLFASANYLHVDFYEGVFDAAMVEYHLARVEQFVAKLDALLDA